MLLFFNALRLIHSRNSCVKMTQVNYILADQRIILFSFIITKTNMITEFYTFVLSLKKCLLLIKNTIVS
jgi:hypothetical protein